MTAYMPLSLTDDWATPQNLFDELHAIHNFTLDVAASSTNHKTHHWFGLDHENPLFRDGLAMSWENNRVWCNPPYGREIKHWVKKAHQESVNAEIVMLLPARTDTAWFHDYAIRHKVTFIRGRLKFGKSNTSAPFPSILVEFK
jgi:site-specific DNA-methyltransferase (adenine-specific)